MFLYVGLASPSDVRLVAPTSARGFGVGVSLGSTAGLGRPNRAVGLFLYSSQSAPHDIGLRNPYLLAAGGAVISSANGMALGASTALGVGVDIDNGVGSSTGSVTVAGVGAAAFAGVGSSTGAVAVVGVGSTATKGVGSATGVATVAGVGLDLGRGDALALGVATVSGTSASGVPGTAAALGSAAVFGTGATGAWVPPTGPQFSSKGAAARAWPRLTHFKP